MIQKVISIYRAAYTGLPREAWLLSIVVLVNRTGSMVLFFMTLYLTRQMDYTVAEAGKMISIYGIGSLFGAFIGGWLTDRIGSRKVQIYSLVLSGFVFIILAYVVTPLSIAITLFILATINEAFRPANATAFSKVCSPEIRARGFGLLRLAVNLGVAIGPAIGGFLALVNYKLLFWIDGITCILASVFLIFAIPADKIVKDSETNKSTLAIKSPWRDKLYLVLLLTLLYMGMVFIQIFNTWPLYLREVNFFFEDQIGLLLALNAILIVIFEMPLIHRVEKKDPLRVMAVGALFLFFGFSITTVNSSYAFVAFTVILWTIGEMLVFPIASGFIANRASDHNIGKYMGMYTFTFALSFVIGPVTGAYIYEEYGPVVLWTSIGLIGLVVLVAYRLMHDYIERH